jgi:hypothetical protein
MDAIAKHGSIISLQLQQYCVVLHAVIVDESTDHMHACSTNNAGRIGRQPMRVNAKHLGLERPQRSVCTDT